MFWPIRKTSHRPKWLQGHCQGQFAPCLTTVMRQFQQNKIPVFYKVITVSKLIAELGWITVLFYFLI